MKKSGSSRKDRNPTAGPTLSCSRAEIFSTGKERTSPLLSLNSSARRAQSTLMTKTPIKQIYDYIRELKEKRTCGNANGNPMRIGLICSKAYWKTPTAIP